MQMEHTTLSDIRNLIEALKWGNIFNIFRVKQLEVAAVVFQLQEQKKWRKGPMMLILQLGWLQRGGQRSQLHEQ